MNKNGKEIKIVRNNGIEELNHRWSRMHIRRRTGRSRTTKEMEKCFPRGGSRCTKINSNISTVSTDKV
jgi:hypothetical protein